MLFLSGFGVQGRASLAAHGHREPGQGSVSAPSLPGTAVSGHIPQPWQFSAHTFFKNRNFKNISEGWQKCPGLQVFVLAILWFGVLDSQCTLQTCSQCVTEWHFPLGLGAVQGHRVPGLKPLGAFMALVKDLAQISNKWLPNPRVL